LKVPDPLERLVALPLEWIVVGHAVEGAQMRDIPVRVYADTGAIAIHTPQEIVAREDEDV
jgi:hypothetical protein